MSTNSSPRRAVEASEIPTRVRVDSAMISADDPGTEHHTGRPDRRREPVTVEPVAPHDIVVRFDQIDHRPATINRVRSEPLPPDAAVTPPADAPPLSPPAPDRAAPPPTPLPTATTTSHATPTRPHTSESAPPLNTGPHPNRETFPSDASRRVPDPDQPHHTPACSVGHMRVHRPWHFEHRGTGNRHTFRRHH